MLISNSEKVDKYILEYPLQVQIILNKIRSTIKEVASNAQEKISYGMPTFFLNGILVHFAAYKNHIGFYPTPSGIEAFKSELSIYNSSKGSVQFPLNKPIPYNLIRQIVEFRVEENKHNNLLK